MFKKQTYKKNIIENPCNILQISNLFFFLFKLYSGSLDAQTTTLTPTMHFDATSQDMTSQDMTSQSDMTSQLDEELAGALGIHDRRPLILQVSYPSYEIN